MNTAPIESDPLTSDHAVPNPTDELQAAATRTTEIAKDHFWLITGGLFLLGILVGAAATQATTPEPTVRSVAKRSVRSARNGAKRATRQLASQLPARVRPNLTLFDRIVHALESVKLG